MYQPPPIIRFDAGQQFAQSYNAARRTRLAQDHAKLEHQRYEEIERVLGRAREAQIGVQTAALRQQLGFNEQMQPLRMQQAQADVDATRAGTSFTSYREQAQRLLDPLTREGAELANQGARIGVATSQQELASLPADQRARRALVRAQAFYQNAMGLRQQASIPATAPASVPAPQPVPVPRTQAAPSQAPAPFIPTQPGRFVRPDGRPGPEPQVRQQLARVLQGLRTGQFTEAQVEQYLRALGIDPNALD
ncbi:MAG: hypothetical protein AAFX41_05225 [Bacteroidota bacterium]